VRLRRADAVPNTILGSPYLATSRDGRLGLVPCHNIGWLGPKPGNVLSVIDLTSPDLKVVQKIPIAVPTVTVSHPDGSQLFVQLTAANRIVVYDVNEFVLRRSPYVVRVGHAPASMGLARSFRTR